MPGKVLSVMVRDGDLVEAGQALVVIEAMKMETTLAAESAAMVKHVRVEEGQMVDHGAVLIELSPSPASSVRESAPRVELIQSSKSPSRSTTISNLPFFKIETRPGCAVRSGITTASREIPIGSITAKILSISFNVTALSMSAPRASTLFT